MNEKQKIAHDAFILGVKWTVKAISKLPIKCSELGDREENLIVARAEKALKAVRQ